MYRLLIVDDEPEIRLGLRLKINGANARIEIAGEASNGIEALRKLEEEEIDIVLTDMSMPVMDGVSFLEACRERYPEVRLVVVTGYEDFQYARAALKHQASDYLLKPVARDELAEVLGKIVGELEGEREETAREARRSWELSRYFEEMKEAFLVRLIRGEPDREDAIVERARRFGLEQWADREARFLTVGLRERRSPTDAQRSPSQFRLPLELICREHAQESTGSCEAYRDTNAPGWMHFVTTESEEWLRSFADSLARHAERLLGFELVVGFGDGAEGFRRWKDGHLSSLIAWHLAASEGRSEDGESSPAPASAEWTDEEARVIERSLAKGDLEGFEQAIRQPLRDAFRVSGGTFVKRIFQLCLMLESSLGASGTALGGTGPLWLYPQTALTLDSVDKAVDYMARLAENLVSEREKETEGDDTSIIEAAKRYIDDNYMTDLNLSGIAERFNYNASYFSELFKSKMGRTFIQYVTEVRMNQAIRLLEATQLSLWDIAELTGFSNASYFSSKFKKLYGMAPSEYRVRASEKIDSEEPKK